MLENMSSQKNLMDKNDQKFLNNYFARYKRALHPSDLNTELLRFRDLSKRVGENGNKLIFAGNGASASIASHAATDFTQHAKVRTVCFNDHNLITAFSNDYGYENWVARALESYADSGDLVVLISSSGESSNIINAAKYARENNLGVITFSGFAPDNPLRKNGMLNFWVDSRAYNVVESVHLIWILAVANLLVQSDKKVDFIEKHFKEYEHALFETDYSAKLVKLRDLCRSVCDKGGKMIFAGNGGSSSIASHAATDFTKQGKVRTICFNDHNLISAFSNDYGQDHWIEKCIDAYADPDDAVVLISSSGRSNNVINAANIARQKGLPVVTFSGIDSENPLRLLGDENFWVNSRNYNVAEAVHAVLICCAVDMLVGKAEYATSDA